MMKTLLPMRAKHSALLILLLSLVFNLNAQNINSDPGAYMSAITHVEMAMNKTYLAYMSAVAHNGRAKKVEKKRQQTLKSIQDCKMQIANLPYFKGDNSLRKCNMDYVDMCYRIFDDDYTHIVNMEDLVEQTFDEMQLYILLIEKTNDKLQEAIDRVDSAGKEFGQKYNITIVNENDKISKDMEITSEVTKYRYKLFLLFYKCNWQDGEITKAVNDKKLTNIEEARNALDTYAKDGLAAMDSLNNFHGDQYLAQTCKQSLQFYQKLAENYLPKITDFFLQTENFNKLQKAFSLKPKKSLTKQEVDNYNKAVNDYNAGINNYNQLNSLINTQRQQIIDNWNNAEKRFMDAHIPYVRS